MVEGYGDVALGAEVVDLVGLDFFEDAAEAGAVAEVAVVEDHAGVGVVGVGVEVVDAVGVEGAGAADDAVDFVAFGEQEFGEVGAVLPGDAGDECTRSARVRGVFLGDVVWHGIHCLDYTRVRSAGRPRPASGSCAVGGVVPVLDGCPSGATKGVGCSEPVLHAFG